MPEVDNTMTQIRTIQRFSSLFFAFIVAIHSQLKDRAFARTTKTMMYTRYIAFRHGRQGIRALSSISTGNLSSGRSTAAAVGAATLFSAAFLLASQGTTAALEEEYKFQKRPEQKYPSPERTPIHLKQSHHSDYNDPPPRPDLPTFTLEEVAEHNDESSMYFTFRGAVYDMTFFINGHPGGTPRLLMAAGQDLEPYWEVYRQHLRGHVVAWMEVSFISVSPAS